MVQDVQPFFFTFLLLSLLCVLLLVFFFFVVFLAPRDHPILTKSEVTQLLRQHNLKSVLLEGLLLLAAACFCVVLIGPLHPPFPLHLVFLLLVTVLWLVLKPR